MMDCTSSRYRRLARLFLRIRAQEYVLLLCRYDGVTMIDHRRFCLPQFNSGQHKLMVGIYEMNVCLGTSVITGQDFNEGPSVLLF